MDLTNEYGTKEIQEYLVPILKDVDYLCRENDIKYSLMGGALLGCIRHGGFVPWDDDIDIIFDRENYDKFIKIAEDKLPEQYLITGSIWVKRITRKDNPRIEVEEGCLDLFVFDNIPECKLLAGFKNLILKLLQGMLKVEIDYKKYTFLNKMLVWTTHILGKFFSKDLKLKVYDYVCRLGNNRHTSKINNYITYFHMISTMKYDADVVKKYKNAKFENLDVMIFEEYDKVLKTQFGNYMELPPKEKRVPTHLKRL